MEMGGEEEREREHSGSMLEHKGLLPAKVKQLDLRGPRGIILTEAHIQSHQCESAPECGYLILTIPRDQVNNNNNFNQKQ